MADNIKNFDCLLSVKEAAEFLGVSQTTIRNWDKAGKLSAKRHPINNYRLYDPDNLEDLLKSTQIKIIDSNSADATGAEDGLPDDLQADIEGFRPQIVIVEDNDKDIEILKQALKNNGYEKPLVVLKGHEAAIKYFTARRRAEQSGKALKKERGESTDD